MDKRVIVGMSGGVDSSVAAALLQQEGYDVIGVTLVLAPDEKDRNSDASPVSSAAARSAQAVCRRLGVPWHEIERRELFRQEVIRPFCKAYARGRTPNPCVICNRRLKFPLLLEAAESFGAAFIATGHYARITPDAGRHVLRRGLDERKDQSYYLFGLDPAILPRVLMPIGDLARDEVQRLATTVGLAAHARPASQDVCFAAEDDYGALVRAFADTPPVPGPIYDTGGKRLGEHRGVAFYTVGQRRGLGISARRPLYVVEIEADRNALIVGTEDWLTAHGLTASAPSWISVEPPTEPFEALVKIRYNHAGTMGRVTPLDENTVRVNFFEAVRAVTPGQACVFYDGDLVLGGAWIEHGAEG